MRQVFLDALVAREVQRRDFHSEYLDFLPSLKKCPKGVYKRLCDSALQ